PGKAVCIDCLAATIPAGSPPFTRIEIRRALREMTTSPGSLDFLWSFLCHLCREERPCLVSSTICPAHVRQSIQNPPTETSDEPTARTKTAVESRSLQANIMTAPTKFMSSPTDTSTT